MELESRRVFLWDFSSRKIQRHKTINIQLKTNSYNSFVYSYFVTIVYLNDMFFSLSYSLIRYILGLLFLVTVKELFHA